MKDKYLIIGTGKISNQLSSILLDHNLKPTVIALSKLDNHKCDDINQYFTIIYVGYDHFSLCKNISKLKSFVKHLETRKYQGNFIFLNTQGILSNHIIQNFSNTLNHKLDRYLLTKRLQSKILNSSKLDITQLYLPIVTNVSGILDLLISELKTCKKIKLPNSGNNKFYVLDIKKLAEYIMNSSLLGRINNFFIYSSYTSLSQLIKHHQIDIIINDDDNMTLEKTSFMSLLRSIVSTMYYCFLRTNYRHRNIDTSSSNLDSGRLSRNLQSLFSKHYIKPESLKLLNKKI